MLVKNLCFGLRDLAEILGRESPRKPANSESSEESSEGEQSPTSSKLAVRMALSQAASHDWDMFSFDVSAAFLQQDEIESMGTDEQQRWGETSSDLLRPW